MLIIENPALSCLATSINSSKPLLWVIVLFGKNYEVPISLALPILLQEEPSDSNLSTAYYTTWQIKSDYKCTMYLSEKNFLYKLAVSVITFT